MENASKALIIAGAILLSILLISLGILVYNLAKGTIGGVNLDPETIQAFNTKIAAYCGENKTNRDMNALVDAIAASNGAQNGLADQHYVAVLLGNDCKAASGGAVEKPDGDGDDGKFSYPTFNAGHKYKATYKTDKTGYIVSVTIENYTADSGEEDEG